VHHATEIRNKHVGFLASFHDPGKIFEQISIIYALPRLFIGSFTLVLPFFPTGTAERVRQQQQQQQQQQRRSAHSLQHSYSAVVLTACSTPLPAAVAASQAGFSSLNQPSH
jgi:hypothetical protein